MKILAVGDVHGNRKPLEIAKKHADEVDKIVFVGDYVDSFYDNWISQKAVLEDILEFKSKNTKVITLWGNHDHAYISDPHVSGHQNVFHSEMGEYFMSNIGQFDIMFSAGNWVFSHAGISKEWLGKYFKDGHIEKINEAFQSKMLSCFDHQSYDPYGNDVTEGPLWIRPDALIDCSINMNQCVGHTEIGECGTRVFNCAEGNRLVVIDSSDRNIYAIINTETDDFVMGKEDD